VKAFYKARWLLKNKQSCRRGFGSAGTFENSPAFQCRVGFSRLLSLAETADKSQADVQPSLRDSFHPASNPGVKTPGYFQMSLTGQLNERRLIFLYAPGIRIEIRAANRS